MEKQLTGQSHEGNPAENESSVMQHLAAENLETGGSFASLLQFLKNRRWFLIFGLLFGLAAAEALDLLVRRSYTSLAQIEIVPDLTPEFSLEQITSMMSGGSGGSDTEKLETEIAILQSPTLELETIRSLQLDRNPTFLPYQNGRPWNLLDPMERAKVIKAFDRDLDVKRYQQTDIIQVNMRTRDPMLSALIANTLIDKYIERSFQANYQSTIRVSGWLNTQLGDLRKNLEKSQQEMIAYQKDLGLVGLTLFSPRGEADTSSSSDIVVQGLDEMIKNSAEASVDRMTKEALYDAIKSSPPDVIDATASLADPELLASKEALISAQSEYASVSHTYGKAYPPLQALQKQIDQLQQKIIAEEHSAVVSAQKQYEASLANETMMQKNLDAQKKEAFGKGEQTAKFEFALEDYESNRMLYDGLQEHLQEADISSGLHSTSIQSVDSADIEPKPSFPRAMINLPIGSAMGLLIGFGLALLFEGVDVNLKTISEIELGLRLPLLAAIPSVKSPEIAPEAFADHATAGAGGSWSRIAEALRELRSSILLSSPGSPPKVVMIASSRPSEGKSSVSTLFGVTLALSGSKVLVIDADLRRPTVNVRFGLGRQTGLSSVLSGKSTLKESIIEWPKMPNLHIMTAGPTPPLPSELLGSKRMEEIIAALRPNYDFIILDTPPVLAVADALMISRVTDGVVLLVRYGTVQRHVAQRCIDLLERSGARFLGVVINAVDFKSPAYSEYYGRKYSDYYGEKAEK